MSRRLLLFFTNAEENRRARERIQKPAEAKDMTTGHGGRVVGVRFAGENVLGIGEKLASSFRRFRSQLSAVFWSRTKANGGT